MNNWSLSLITDGNKIRTELGSKLTGSHKVRIQAEELLSIPPNAFYVACWQHSGSWFGIHPLDLCLVKGTSYLPDREGFLRIFWAVHISPWPRSSWPYSSVLLQSHLHPFLPDISQAAASVHHSPSAMYAIDQSPLTHKRYPMFKFSINLVEI